MTHVRIICLKGRIDQCFEWINEEDIDKHCSTYIQHVLFKKYNNLRMDIKYLDSYSNMDDKIIKYYDKRHIYN